MSNIVANSDVTVTITVYQSDGTTAYDLVDSTLTIAVYQSKERIIQKFVNADITRVSDEDGQIRIFIDRRNLKNIPEKKLYAEIQVENSSASFADSAERLRVTDIELGTIVNSVLG